MMMMMMMESAWFIFIWVILHYVQYRRCIESDERMTDEWIGKGLEGRNRSLNGVLFWNLSEETEKNHHKPLSR
jgi:hypothetical protein